MMLTYTLLIERKNGYVYKLKVQELPEVPEVAKSVKTGGNP